MAAARVPTLGTIRPTGRRDTYPVCGSTSRTPRGIVVAEVPARWLRPRPCRRLAGGGVGGFPRGSFRPRAGVVPASSMASPASMVYRLSAEAVEDADGESLGVVESARRGCHQLRGLELADVEGDGGTMPYSGVLWPMSLSASRAGLVLVAGDGMGDLGTSQAPMGSLRLWTSWVLLSGAGGTCFGCGGWSRARGAVKFAATGPGAGAPCSLVVVLLAVSALCSITSGPLTPQVLSSRAGRTHSGRAGVPPAGAASVCATLGSGAGGPRPSAAVLSAVPVW